MDSAIGNIDEALKLFPNDSSYKSKHDYYVQFVPFALYKKNSYSRMAEETGDFYGRVYFNQTETSNDCREMKNCITWYNNNTDYSTTYSVYYDLNGTYDVLSGTYFLPGASNHTKLNGKFVVYGDGTKLYTSPDINGDVFPTDFTVNISGVRTLKIVFYGGAESTLNGGEGENYSISNLTATKNFPN